MNDEGKKKTEATEVTTNSLNTSAVLQEPKEPRWDQELFVKEINKYYIGDDTKKIWICGPPIMQENFDRATSVM